ncbi:MULTISPECIES: hypothetical protein [unclassified Streptomyces]
MYRPVSTVVVETGRPKGSLFEELEVREATTRRQVEELNVELADLTGW